ncbi:hypothetical protein [Actinomadura chibensis]|uniref:Uncharacterized protein n=1 Tax=Actinomadura chibensis TaxID=392828 RepID=A0A5D0NFF8_9ACTN|nr:hypothetical protein [Actinomadura chibensis]TYB42975.1 hypothetical protein FXF69_29940 [Actinomadura chibensis]
MRRPPPLFWLCASVLAGAQVLYRVGTGDWAGGILLVAAACLVGAVAGGVRGAALRARRTGGGVAPKEAVPGAGESALRSWLPLLAAVAIAIAVLCIALT